MILTTTTITTSEICIYPQSLMENVILMVATATAKTISDDNCDHI